VSTTEAPSAAANPLFEESPLYLNYPRFDLIDDAHYLPAFQRGMAEQIAEIEAIASQREEPTFDNTVLALELSGQLLTRVASVFFAMSSAHTNDAIRAIEQQLAPELAAHQDAILLNRDLFARVQSLHEQRASLGLANQMNRVSAHRSPRTSSISLSARPRSRLNSVSERSSIRVRGVGMDPDRGSDSATTTT